MITDALVGMLVRVGETRLETLSVYVTTHPLIGMVWKTEEGNLVNGQRDVTGAFRWTLTDVFYTCPHCGGIHEAD